MTVHLMVVLVINCFFALKYFEHFDTTTAKLKEAAYEMLWAVLGAFSSSTTYIQFRRVQHGESTLPSHVSFYLLLFIEYLILIVIVPLMSDDQVFSKECFDTLNGIRCFAILFPAAIVLQVN